MLRLRWRVACPELVEGLRTKGALGGFVLSPFVLSVTAPAAKSKDIAAAHNFAVDAALVVCSSYAKPELLFGEGLPTPPQVSTAGLLGGLGRGQETGPSVRLFVQKLL